MRNSRRLFAVATSIGLFSLCSTGLAAASAPAHESGGDTNSSASVSQYQGNLTDQYNYNFAPVTQVNPALNLGLLNKGDQVVVQDNSIDSSNNQSNSNATGQSQQGAAGSAIVTLPAKKKANKKKGSGSGDKSSSASVSQGQQNSTSQGNYNVAPVTQVNPAVNVGALNKGDQVIFQDNSIDSSNNQSNSNSTSQDQVGQAVSGIVSGGKSGKGDKSSSASVEQGQTNETSQENKNFSPVTQVNPALNVGLLNKGDQVVVQDNSIKSSNNQSNSNSTSQSQLGKVVSGLLGG